MKYSDGTYLMTASDKASIRNRMATFRAEAKTRKAVRSVMVTLVGARHNAHHDSIVLSEVRESDWLKGENSLAARASPQAAAPGQSPGTWPEPRHWTRKA